MSNNIKFQIICGLFIFSAFGCAEKEPEFSEIELFVLQLNSESFYDLENNPLNVKYLKEKLNEFNSLSVKTEDLFPRHVNAMCAIQEKVNSFNIKDEYEETYNQIDSLVKLKIDAEKYAYSAFPACLNLHNIEFVNPRNRD